MTRKQMKARVAEIKRILERRESECVYGSPEFMKEWRQETNDMKRELDSLQDVLHHRKRN